jgi:hypothetical protein
MNDYPRKIQGNLSETGLSDFWKAQEVSHMACPVSFSQTKATKRGYSNSMI